MDGKRGCSGAVNGAWMLLALAAAALTSGCQRVGPREPKGTLRAYVVHHVEHSIRKLAKQFEEDTGIRVEATYACRGRPGKPRPPERARVHQLVMRNRDGDIYVTSRRLDLEWAQTDGVGSGPIVPIGEMVPVIEVLKGNPKNIRSLEDLARKGVRVSLAIGCVGAVAATILDQSKLSEKVAPNVVLRIRHERPAASSVDGEKVDATITWLSTLREVGPEKYDAIAIPADKNLIEPVLALVLDTGRNKAAAERFATFLQSPKAQKLLAEDGLKRQD